MALSGIMACLRGQGRRLMRRRRLALRQQKIPQLS